MRLLGKKHWLIRQTVSKHQFTLVIGRNQRFNDYRNAGFEHADSDAGQAIIEKCVTTTYEQKEKARAGQMSYEF